MLYNWFKYEVSKGFHKFQSIMKNVFLVNALPINLVKFTEIFSRTFNL